MQLIRLLATFFLLPVTLPVSSAALDRESLEGLPTIIMDGVSCTLHDAVLAATTGTTVGGCTGFPGIEVIQLDANVTLAEASLISSMVGGAQAGLPDITSPVIITAGSGSVIERDAALPCGPNEPTAFRLFNIPEAGSLFLMDVILRGGCVAPAAGVVAQGGAIHLDGGSLELTNMVLENHQARGLESEESGALGGALYCLAGTVSSISNSTFRSNTALGTDDQATQTVAEGGAGFFDQCQLARLESTLFDSNTAIGSSNRDGNGVGGALFFFDSSLGIIEQNEFLDNVAQGGDDATGGTSSQGQGGAMWVDNGTIDFFGSNTFLRNQARAGNSMSSSGNIGRGGAIGFTGFGGSGSSATIVQSHFEDNLALAGDAGGTSSPGDCEGGAIFVTSSFHLSGIEDSLFRGNQCLSGVGAGGGTRAEGGAIAVASSGSLGPMDRVTFENNLARAGTASTAVNANGGALNVEGSVSRLRNSTFIGNRVVGGTDVDPGDPGGTGRGGAVSIFGQLDTIHANTFVDNVAQGGFGTAGSGLGLGGAIYIDTSVPVDFAGNLLTGNRTEDVDGIATLEDCRDEGPGLVSGGWNRVEAAGNCSFAATGDVTGVATATYPPADWGCVSSLLDGSCVPTVAIDETSGAIDQGSCTDLSLERDSRFTIRPFDLVAVVNADDGCDIGAFEATDPDGDGFTEATDCAPDDPTQNALDRCGICGGDGTSCLIFEDGFESGDTSMWEL